MIEVVAIRNVELCVSRILDESNTIRRLVDEGRVAVVGAVFDITTGKINFLQDHSRVNGYTPSDSLLDTMTQKT